MSERSNERIFSVIHCFLEYCIKDDIFNPTEFISYCNKFDIKNSEKIFSRDESAAKSLNNEMHPHGAQATIDLAQMAELEEDSLVLDAGCGHGGASRILASNFPTSRFIGIDSDFFRVVDAIFRSKKLFPSNLEFKQDDGYNMSFDDNMFDLVIRQHSVYGGDERDFIKECKRVLKKGGKIAFQNALCTRSLKNEKMFMDDYTYDEYCKLLETSGFKFIKSEIERSTKELLESVREKNRSYYQLIKNGILIGIKLVAEKL